MRIGSPNGLCGRCSKLRVKVLALSVAAISLLAPAAATAGDSIAAILRSPTSYDGKHVDVTGTIRGLREKTSHKGNAYDTFSICSDGCLHVFTFGRPRITDGQTITVHGTFAAVKHVGAYTFRNEIDADEGSL
jgi:hypothetical protein